MHRANRDLLFIGALSAAGLLVLVAPAPDALRALIWVPLACFCPGYSLAAALFPRRSLGGPERLLLSVGLSLAAVILGAVGLHATGLALQQPVWAGLVVGVTLVASLAALLRRRREGAPAAARAGGGLPARQWALLGLAGLVLTGATALARAPLPAASVQGYTTLWILPEEQAGVYQARIGVESAELTTMTYRLEVAGAAGLGGVVPQIQLAPGETWEATVVIPADFGNRPIEAVLFLQAEPGVVYRRVMLWPQASRP